MTCAVRYRAGPVQGAGNRPAPARRRATRRPHGVAAACCLVLLGTGTVPSTAAGDGVGLTSAVAGEPGVTIRNDSGRTVSAIRMSPDFAVSWGGNRMNGTLAPGTEVDIDLPSRSECFFDIQVEGEDGAMHEMWSLNLCQQRLVTVK